MQGLTCNSLADSGLLGVNAGASFAVVLAIRGFGLSGTGALAGLRCRGAGGAATQVFALGSLGRAGRNPIWLVLAGAAILALLGSIFPEILLHLAAPCCTLLHLAARSGAGADAKGRHGTAGGRPIRSLPTGQVARELALLPQGPRVPVGISVRDLVAQGRTPHHSFFCGCGRGAMPARWTRP